MISSNMLDVLNDKKDNVFGERLKNLRSVLMKMTQKEFSEFMGIPQPTLSSYESGRNKPTIDVVINIANKCNVSVDWLCGNDNVASIKSLADLMNILFDIYEANEFSFKTVIHDRIDIEKTGETDDALRNWIQMTFYHNESRLHPEQIYCADICNMIKKAYELHSELANYDCSQEYYDAEKRKFLDMYSKFPITKANFSSISEDERKKLRKEKLRAELENEMKNNA